MSKKILAVCAVFALSFLAFSREIRVASFEVQGLCEVLGGKARLAHGIGEAMNEFDVVALQGVGSDADVVRLVKSANALAPSQVRWSFVRSGQFAVAYRADRVEAADVAECPGAFGLKVSPVSVRLLVDGLDFVLLSVRVSPDSANSEIPALKTVILWACVEYGTDKVACVGDYRADWPWYFPGTGYCLRGFDSYATAIPNADGFSEEKAYDRAELTQGLNRHFTGTYGVFSRKVPGVARPVVWFELSTDPVARNMSLADH